MSLGETNSDLLGVVILEVVVAGIGLGATLVISFSEHENSKRKPGSEPGCVKWGTALDVTLRREPLLLMRGKPRPIHLGRGFRLLQTQRTTALDIS